MASDLIGVGTLEATQRLALGSNQVYYGYSRDLDQPVADGRACEHRLLNFHLGHFRYGL